MRSPRTVTARIFAALSVAACVWLALGWIDLAVNGPNWSASLARIAFSAIAAVIGLIGVGAAGERNRGARATCLTVAALGGLSLVAAFAVG